MKNPEQSPQLQSEEQLAIDNISRQLLDSAGEYRSNLAEVDPELRANISELSKGIVTISKDEGMQTLLPGLASLERTFSRHEAARNKIGQEKADMVFEKLQEETSRAQDSDPEFRKLYERWVNFALNVDDLTEEVHTQEFIETRDMLIERTRSENRKAKDTLLSDHELQKEFADREEELTELLDSYVDKSDVGVDYIFVQNMVAGEQQKLRNKSESQ